MKNGSETIRRVLRREKRKLAVQLTESESLDRARQVAALDGEIEGLEKDAETLKTEVKSLAATAEVKLDEMRAIARALRMGSEERDVPVSIEVDRTGTVYEIRVDTNEVVRERPLTAQEAQEAMDFGVEPGSSRPMQQEIDVTPPALPPAEEEDDDADR